MNAADAALQLGSVTLVDLPVPLHLRAREHSEGLQREFALLADYAERGDSSSVPARLLDLVRALRGNYGAFTIEQDNALDAAETSGQPTMTMTFRVPVGAAGAAEQLGAMLDEADEFCRSGHLLTLATPPDLLTYRHWYLTQFVEQLRGADPVPWQGSVQAAG